MAWKLKLAPVSPHSWNTSQHSFRVSDPMAARGSKNSLWLKKWNKDQEGETFCDQSLCSEHGCLKILELCQSALTLYSDLVLTLANWVWSSFYACTNQKMTGLHGHHHSYLHKIPSYSVLWSSQVSWLMVLIDLQYTEHGCTRNQVPVWVFISVNYW